jgi:hypothetical protein
MESNGPRLQSAQETHNTDSDKLARELNEAASIP